MKSISGTLGSIVLTVLLGFCLLLIANDALAQEDETTLSDGKIEVEYPAEAQAPYQERRENWSTVFAVNVDQILPDKFRSKVSSDSYETLFGTSPIQLVQVQLGAKYNFSLGGIGIAGIFGHGEIEDGRSGSSRDLTLEKKGIVASLVLDNLTSEPYLAPYLEGHFYSFDWSDGVADQNLESQEGSTAFGSAITVGALFQLNWLDPEAAIAAQNSSGLENAFLDVFVSQYGTSGSEDDPNFETSTNFGAGLRLEF